MASELTGFAVGDPEAIQRWEEMLTYEAEVQAYFHKFEGTANDSMIVVKDALSKGAGEKVTFTLRGRLSGDGAEGDTIIEDTAVEESLDFFSDSLLIDQRRKGTLSKGKMSQQRVSFKIRKECGDALQNWFIEDRDQQYFIYASGARGVNADFHVPTTFTGRAGNALRAPSADRIIYAGNATAKIDLAADDLMSLSLVERLVALAETTDPMMMPFMVDGEKKFILLMHTWQAFALRTSTTANDWLDIQKATQRDKAPLFFKNALGEYADVVLHKHRSIIRFDDYGATVDLPAARALFFGAQAMVCAYGRNVENENQAGADLKGRRVWWNEETADRGNRLAVTGGIITGVQKTKYDRTVNGGTSTDFGVVAVETYCKDPNATA